MNRIRPQSLVWMLLSLTLNNKKVRKYHVIFLSTKYGNHTLLQHISKHHYDDISEGTCIIKCKYCPSVVLTHLNLDSTPKPAH